MNVHDKWILRYANCWEDAGLLVKHIAGGAGKKLLSVASGGENSLSLLCTEPSELWVADINPLQLHVFELKRRGVQLLPRETFLGFAGYSACGASERMKIYNSIRKNMRAGSVKFWDANRGAVETGFIFSGRLEKNLRFFARYIRPLIHSNKTAHQLLESKAEKDQAAFYDRHWDTLKWKYFFRIFFSRTLLRFIAPDPSFFNYVDDNVTEYLYRKLAIHLRSESVQSNHILHFALFGNYGNILPHYVQEENYETIQKQCDKIKIFEGSVEKLFEAGHRFDGFNLSNIFEYTEKKEFTDFSAMLLAGGEDAARYVYWNLMLPRKISDEFPQQAIQLLDSSEQENFSDKGFLYFRMCVDEKIAYE